MDPSGQSTDYPAWDGERASASPEGAESFPFPSVEMNGNTVFDFNPFARFYESAAVPMRPPLASPTNLKLSLAPPLSSSAALFAPLTGTTAQQLTTAAVSFAPPPQGRVSSRAMRGPPYLEDSTSNDATPESSDIEEDNRAKKVRRTKHALNQEQAVQHSQESQRFPNFITRMRERLLNESPDGRVQEAAAVSALIQEFTREREETPFTLPSDCEHWLRLASEAVQEERQRSKGARKRKLTEGVAIDHTGTPRFQCVVCSMQGETKIFKTQEGLHLHIRNKHETEKQWKCFAHGCAVSFVRQADLRMHLIRMHSSERPYPCKVPFCMKAFAGISELRRHVKVDHRDVVGRLCGGQQVPSPNLI